MVRRLIGVVGLILALGWPGASARAASWPEITKAEWDLTASPGMSNAPAVVLMSRGELHFDHNAVSSYFEFYTRIKILNEEGRKYGTIQIPSSKFSRVKSVDGRTVQPDGRVSELSKDAKFEKKFSAFYNYTVYSFAMPAVEVGSIVEFRYRQFFDSFVFADPWYFDSELPTLYSEIVAEYPLTLGFAPVKFSPFGREIKEKTERSPNSYRTIYSMEKLPPVSDEPYRMPFSDLASWALFIPQEYAFSGRVYDLLKDWKSTVDLMQGSGKNGYKGARGSASSSKSRAKSLAASASSTRGKADAIYRFVRDEISTAPWYGVSVYDRGCDKTLKEELGHYADKALLLQCMLDAVKIKSSLGWVKPRDLGRTQINLPTPFQFDKVLVVADIDGQQVFLDPTDRELPFGHLPPNLEGVPCLLVDQKKPDWVDTPQTPLDENRRSASLDLAVNEDGVLTGEGKLTFKGHSAWDARRRAKAEEAPEDYWLPWLEGRFPGFDIGEIRYVAPAEELQAELSWALTQRAEEALGDEVSLATAAPLALTTNPFSLPPGRRRTPVQLAYGDTDEVQLTVSWPEGWALESTPQLEPFSNEAGTLELQVTSDEAQRELKVRRSFTTGAASFIGTDAYTALHELYGKAAAGDAEQIVLVQR